MCRLAAFPPGTTKDYAHEIVSEFVGCNDDGVGTAHLQGKSFVIKKHPYSYHEAVKKGDDLFEHMPYDGWTIAHVRLATHGKNTFENTHPFIRGDIATVHNGIFGPSDIIKFALHKSVKWQGDTDSEAAAYLIDQYGPERFYKAFNSGGVFLSLHRDGSLSAVKLSGDLEMLRLPDDKIVIASQFPFKGGQRFNSETKFSGSFLLTPEGKPNGFEVRKPGEKKEYQNSYGSPRGEAYHQRTCFSSEDIHDPRSHQDGTIVPFSSNIAARGRGSATSDDGPSPPNTSAAQMARKMTDSKEPITLWEGWEDEAIMEYYRSLP